MSQHMHVRLYFREGADVKRVSTVWWGFKAAWEERVKHSINSERPHSYRNTFGRIPDRKIISYKFYFGNVFEIL